MPFATPIAATILCAQVSFRAGGASTKLSVRENIQFLKIQKSLVLIKEKENSFARM